MRLQLGETARRNFDNGESCEVKPTPAWSYKARRMGQGMSIEKRRGDVARAAGFSVHVFPASGAPVAVLALYAAIERNFAACFAWLGLAFFIDGIDGTLARAAKVQITAASIDGKVADLRDQLLTYVLVPVVALWRSDLMPTQVSFWIGLIVEIASALYFADTRMKTNDDLWFRGFPATWNVVVLYLFVLRPPSILSAVILLGAAAMMFRARRVRAPAQGGQAPRSYHRHEHRLGGSLRGGGGRNEPRAAPMGRLGSDRDGGVFSELAAAPPFALGAGLSRVRRKCPKRLARRIKSLV